MILHSKLVTEISEGCVIKLPLMILHSKLVTEISEGCVIKLPSII